MGSFGLTTTNLTRRAGRTALLALLVSLLAFTLFAGTTVLQALSSGLTSLEARLGADVIVAPKEAKSATDLEKVLVEGVPGNFYMSDEVVARVAERAGVERVSAQYYLATAKAGCCSMPVQIIGIDPATDFTIQPWIARSYARELGELDVVAGCNITGAPGTLIRFYGVDCRMVAKLDETGTALDNAVFCTSATIKRLIQGSIDQGMAALQDMDPSHVVSLVQVKVADGYDVTNVMDDINLHLRDVTAVRARAMTAGVADGVAAASATVRLLVGVVWVLAAVLLWLSFWMLSQRRAREFATLRVLGASRGWLLRVVMGEALIISALGACLGIVLAVLALALFGPALEGALGLPFLLPGAGSLAGVAALALVATLVAGCGASALSAWRLVRVDPGQVLREE